PGEVMACLGFMEVDEFLHGGTRGGFHWREKGGDVEFELVSRSDHNPVESAIDFVLNARRDQLVPTGNRQILGGSKDELIETKTCPPRKPHKFNLPVMLHSENTERSIILDSWADESSREPFKLYAGTSVASTILTNLIDGRPSEGQK